MIKRANAFTIVELLIVIVVIAILAAISIVAYTGIQDRANLTTLKSDLSNLSKKLEIYAVDNDTYPALNGPAYNAADLQFSGSKSIYAENPTVTRNLIMCSSSDLKTYGILAKLKNGDAYLLRKGQALQSFSTTWTTGTTAGSLCSAAGYTTSSAAGYWYQPPTSSGWWKWTGLGTQE